MLPVLVACEIADATRRCAKAVREFKASLIVLLTGPLRFEIKAPDARPPKVYPVGAAVRMVIRALGRNVGREPRFGMNGVAMGRDSPGGANGRNFPSPEATV